MQGCQQASRQKFGVDCEGVVLGYCSIQRAWKLEIQGVKMLLGHWWMMVEILTIAIITKKRTIAVFGCIPPPTPTLYFLSYLQAPCGQICSRYSPDRFVAVQNVINVWFTVVVCSSEEMEDQREDSEACPEDNGVKGVAELPGSVGDPDIQQTGCSYQL